jgi:probable phosphoglycerate mutase
MNSIQSKNRYYLMRHGESVANVKGLIVSAPNNALRSFGLTNHGSQQVTQAALNTRLDRDTIIVSSDYQRALETAEIVKSVIDTISPISIDSRLRERDFGAYELEDHGHYQDVWQQDLSHPDESTNSVESVMDTLARGLDVIASLDQQHHGKSILLVSHGDVLQILLAHHQNMNPRFHRSLSSLGNADIRSLTKLTLASR